MKKRLVTTLAVGVLAVFGLSGCGTHSVSTNPDQVALHYSGGPFSDKKFKSFVGTSTKDWFGPGDKEYVYPAGQRSFDATGAEGSERGPIASTSKDTTELATPVSVTFQLKTDVEILRKFHEQVGIKYKAYADDDSDGTSAGWGRMLNFYVGQSLEATIDRVLAGYEWKQAYNDPKIRVAIQDSILRELPGLVKSKMGDEYFDTFAVQVQRSEPTNEELKKNIAAAQNEVASSQAREAKAKADEAAALAEIAVQKANAAKKKADISAYGSVDQYNKNQAIEKGINPYQPTIIYGGQVQPVK